MERRAEATPHKRACFFLLMFMLIHILSGRLLGLFGIITPYAETALALVISSLAVIIPYLRFMKRTSKALLMRKRIKKIAPSEAIAWFFMGICANCALTMVNMPVNLFWQRMGMITQTINTPHGTAEYMLGILCICIVPAVCEELLCRGLVLGEYEAYGRKSALFISALMFSLLHRDITSAMMTFLLGLMLAYIVFMSGSIVPAMIFHFSVNFFSLSMGYVSENIIPPHVMPDFSLALNIGTLLLALTFVIAALTAVFGGRNVLKTDRHGTRVKYGFCISLIILLAIYVQNAVWAIFGI